MSFDDPYMYSNEGYGIIIDVPRLEKSRTHGGELHDSVKCLVGRSQHHLSRMIK
jgi:hypothetical protein